ncbi:MAG: rhomboid family intramembrane serine protease [Acidobacteria bacterium]|nr:rhomboid family intramembrane serine protease [Acidobacteriota bacterium]
MRTEKGDEGFWVCPSCGGRAANIVVLRRTVARQEINRLWACVREGKTEPGRPCPACERPMVVIHTDESVVQSLSLDVCTRCQFIWFDPKEFEVLPPASPPHRVDEKQLPMEARLLLAKYEIEQIDDQLPLELDEVPPTPDWKTLPAFLGMPVEYENHVLQNRPWATWVLATVVSLFSFLAFLDFENAVREFALIPAEVGRYWGLTLLTAFFLHANWLHLLGNIYFLLVFGDDVEEYLGKSRYLLVLLLAIVTGGVLHSLAHPDSTTPVVGARAGISGILVFYCLQYPRARLGFLVRYLFIFRWIRLRAWMYMLLWIVLQSLGALQQLSGVTQISFLGHLGGATIGLLFWLLWKWGLPSRQEHYH